MHKDTVYKTALDLKTILCNGPSFVSHFPPRLSLYLRISMWILGPREQERLQAAARVARNDRDTMAAALEGLRRIRARLAQVEKGDAQALGFGWILKPFIILDLI